MSKNRSRELTAREIYVVYMRLYRPSMSYRSIGNVLGISLNRVRQLHIEGLRKLRGKLRAHK